MAIQIDLAQSQYGIPFAGAYFRIAATSISRKRSSGGNKFSVMIDVVGYGTSAPEDDTREIDFRRYHTPLIDVEAQLGVTFLDKCYAWLHNQSEFAGSKAV